MKNRLMILFLLSILLIPIFVFAHPGNTDSSGCHTCRTNCPSWGLSYGEYHCHRSKGIPRPVEPIKSHQDSDGTGWTEPAPEYKSPANYQGATTNNSKDSDNWGWWALGIGGVSIVAYKISKKKVNK